MSHSQKVAHQAGWYAAAYTATQFVTVLAAILTRRFLGPVQVGVWAIIQVILSYASYTTLGLANAIPREIPFYVGKGDMDKAARIKQTSFEFVMAMAFVFAAGLVAYALIERSRISGELFWGLLFAGGLVILQQLNNITITLLRCFMRFELAGKQMFLSAIVNAVLVAVLSYRFRLFGFMVAMGLSFLFNVGYIFYFEKVLFRFKLQFKFDFQLIRSLMAYGFPLMLLGLCETFVQTFDRIIISKYLGLELLGIYSIATMVNGFVFSFPNSVGVVLLPNVSEKFGRNEYRRDLKGYLKESDYVFCALMPILIGMAWFLVPPVIQWLLPKFSQGIPSLKYLVLSSFFMAVSQAYTNFVVVIRKQMRLFVVSAITILLAVSLNFWAIRWGGRIEDIARVQTIIFGINFSLIFFLSHFYLEMSASVFVQFGKILLKFGWMLFLLICISKYVRPVNPMIRGIAQTAILLVLYIPFLLRLEKKYQLVSVLMNRLRRAGPSPAPGTNS